MANCFLSHRTSDMPEALKIAEELKNDGHNVWIDELEINIGDSIVGKINDGLSGSTYVIVCYSPSGIEAPWMGREWMSSLARQLGGSNVKLLPVLLKDGITSAILADIKYADLGSDWVKGMNQLRRAIR